MRHRFSGAFSNRQTPSSTLITWKSIEPHQSRENLYKRPGHWKSAFRIRLRFDLHTRLAKKYKQNKAPWVKHFTDMTRGLIPYRKRFYKIQPQTGMGDIQLVTLTQADVQHAKADMKRKLTESMLYKPKSARARPQMGSGQKKKSGGTKKKTAKKGSRQKSNKDQKSTKTKSKTKKKNSKSKKKK